MAGGGATAMAGQKRAFDSVFTVFRLADLAPTPSATPTLAQTGLGESFGGPATLSFSSNPKEALDVYPEPVIWDRAWHTATAFLTIPPHDFTVHRRRDDLDAFAAHYDQASVEAVQAIRYVVSHQTTRRATEQTAGRASIVDWYTDHVRGHFLSRSKASLRRIVTASSCYGSNRRPSPQEAQDVGAVLGRLRHCLNLLQSIYTYPLTQCLIPQLAPLEGTLASKKFQRDLHALVSYALPSMVIPDLFTRFLCQCSRRILGIGDEDFEIVLQDPSLGGQQSDFTYQTFFPACSSMADIEEPGDTFVEPTHVRRIRHELLSFLQSWSPIGLASDDIRKIFAAVLDQMLTDFVVWSYASIDDDESGVLPHLRYWVENVFTRYAVQVLNALRSTEESLSVPSSEISRSDVQNWQQMAITRLGALRVDELFDIVVNWDSSRSRIDDLKHYITNPSTRKYLTSNFIDVLSWSLLQPGISTQQILRVYIAIIRAFRQLDPKGVLLDRVVRPVRRYLRDRSDTVKVIVTGLFSDADDDDGEPAPYNPDVLNELATELKEHGISSGKQDDADIDWDNMEWVPDPADAAPDYKKSQNIDVIGSLMSLFESRDAIVKELQTMLSDRLLMKLKDYNQETTVLELLRVRLGESVLQSCSVMLRDVKRESLNIDRTIRREQGLEAPKREARQQDEEEVHLDLHAKILSHLYWPTLQNQTFKVPTQVLAQQHLYEKGFSALKQSRKLTWLNAIGQVEVELELEDRLFQGEVTPWEASVIYAFESDSRTSEPVRRSIEDVAAELEMAPLLVRSACKLWLSKSILIETSPDMYQVQETLPTGTGDAASGSAKPFNATPGRGAAASSSAAAAAAAAETAASLAASSASSSLLEQKMAVYHQFILSLLTNQGAMPLPRIVMMLGMVVPGGFPFSTDELKDFLGRMVRDGEIEMGAGGVYKAVTAGQQ